MDPSTVERIMRRVGTVIRSKWTLERLLGAGAMAAVYVGQHKIGRHDALKILHPEAARSRDICERFEREARAANRLKHPGAVEIRDIDTTEDGVPFLVMELLAGETLAELELRLGRIPLADLLDHAEQILETLAAAHAEGIIHRDLKPGNLYVTAEGRLKVLDFGLARIRDDTGLQALMTGLGIVLGTTPYMAPEQARGREVDARADLFGVGATLFKLIAGRHVHQVQHGGDLLIKMATEPAPRLAAVDPGVPEAVCLVIDRALAFRPEHRYPDASTMLADVRAVRRGELPPYAAELAFVEGTAIGSAARPAVSAGGIPSGPAAEPVSISIEMTEASDSISIPVEWSEGGAAPAPAPAARPAQSGPECLEATLLSVVDPTAR